MIAQAFRTLTMAAGLLALAAPAWAAEAPLPGSDHWVVPAAGSTYTFTNSDKGQVTDTWQGVQDELVRMSEASDDGTRVYGFDANGNLKEVLAPDGKVTGFMPDNGRLCFPLAVGRTCASDYTAGRYTAGTSRRHSSGSTFVRHHHSLTVTGVETYTVPCSGATIQAYRITSQDTPEGSAAINDSFLYDPQHGIRLSYQSQGPRGTLTAQLQCLR